MNTKILQKCLEELKKETPDLSYLRGTLETLIEMAGGEVVSTGSYVMPHLGVLHTEVGKVDEITDVDKEYERRQLGGPIAKLES